MATISLTIPDPILVRVIDGISYKNGYTDTIPNPANPSEQIPNPVTKAQFAKNVLKEWIKDNVVYYEAGKAAELARQAALNDANTDITIGD